MQRLKRAIKKMAAIGTGVAMLGATMTGAMAQDLADYPAPFVGASGIFDASTAIVVGDAAAASDTLGAVDIATNLQFMAKTPVQSGAGTVQVSGGVTEDIPIGRGIANDTAYAFDWRMDDADIDSFMDTTVQFQGKDYDIHDEIVLRKDSPNIVTSVTESEDDYESGVYMHAEKKSMYYMLMVDDTDLNITKATSTEPFEVKFLGKTLKITEVPDDNVDRFQAYVGTEYFMDVGDVVTVEGKKVTLVNVGTSGAIIIDVDGTIDTVTASATKTINGIEIANDETFYSSTKSERAASLIIGKDAEATYRHEDAFIGEDTNNPNWKWVIGNLGDKGDTILDSMGPDENKINFTLASGPYIGIYNNFRATSPDDNPVGIGDCYDLPNNYASICMDSLTVSDEDYITVTIEYVDNADLEESRLSTLTTSSDPAIYIHSDTPNVFKIAKGTMIDANGTLNGADIKTNEIWINYMTEEPASNMTGVFYKDVDHSPQLRFLGNTSWGGAVIGEAAQIALINYKDTKDANINLTLHGVAGTENNSVVLGLNVNGDATSELTNTADDIYINFTISQLAASDLSALGITKGEPEPAELRVNNNTLALGEKDEDQRTRYGIIIKDPKSNGGGDRVVLQIPADQVQANVVVKGQAATVSGGSTSFIPADITIDTKLSSEVAGAESAHQLILIGGPCANPTVEAVSSLGTTCSGWTMGAGEAIIKMASNGSKVALLIAGTDAVDTRMAAKVVANYEDYDLSGSSVAVTGSMSSPVLKVA